MPQPFPMLLRQNGLCCTEEIVIHAGLKRVGIGRQCRLVFQVILPGKIEQGVAMVKEGRRRGDLIRAAVDDHINDRKASAVPLYHTFRQKESLSFVKSSLRYCSGDRSSNHQCPGYVPGNRNDPVHRNPLPASEISLCSGCSGKKQQTVILRSSDQQKPLSSQQKRPKQYNHPPGAPLSRKQPSFPRLEPYNFREFYSLFCCKKLCEKIYSIQI